MGSSPQWLLNEASDGARVQARGRGRRSLQEGRAGVNGLAQGSPWRWGRPSGVSWGHKHSRPPELGSRSSPKPPSLGSCALVGMEGDRVSEVGGSSPGWTSCGPSVLTAAISSWPGVVGDTFYLPLYTSDSFSVFKACLATPVIQKETRKIDSLKSKER